MAEQKNNSTSKPRKQSNNIPKQPKKTANKRLKPTASEMKTLELMSRNPYDSMCQIGKKCVEEGIDKNPKQIYVRWKKSDYLQVEVPALEERHKEELMREDMPLASRKLRKALKELNSKEAFPYVKLVYDRVLGDKMQSPTIIGNVNIGSIQVAIREELANRE